MFFGNAAAADVACISLTISDVDFFYAAVVAQPVIAPITSAVEFTRQVVFSAFVELFGIVSNHDLKVGLNSTLCLKQ
ncbi:hypothetical protein LIER_37410 [Lithospermum erythrorhizon]|uniref:Uncharacterized protein n=1 Tax=Lithospermum erythrorhizon TaxID=34254 RepID=A0AAV3PK19_LITER